MEVTHVRQVLMKRVYQQLDAIESQSPTFMMEIKVDVVSFGIGDGLQCLFHGILDGKLVPLVVDQIDKVGISVKANLLFDMEFQSFDLQQSSG